MELWLLVLQVPFDKSFKGHPLVLLVMYPVIPDIVGTRQTMIVKQQQVIPQDPVLHIQTQVLLQLIMYPVEIL